MFPQMALLHLEGAKEAEPPELSHGQRSGAAIWWLSNGIRHGSGRHAAGTAAGTAVATAVATSAVATASSRQAASEDDM